MSSRTTRGALIMAALSLFLVAGCSGGSAAGAKPSATGALAPGATCPSATELAGLTSGAISGTDGGSAKPTFDGGTVCDGEWAAATFTVDDVPGRVALKWDGTAWTPVLVGGTGGPCPKTVQAAPDDVRKVLDC